ncbi:hypothetical protein ATL17_0476 [Maritalea mobilis]|uniref:Uncharacterized protein n=1 Tax=Maritalea mobilis TaxID=483324 RepID=A0A4R6VR54_9HYPH|nr:hypothetical protein [Maritalea mobilis]TDQ66479.1 hypothetical protein ATL17_0476 [Maritalea mobilis]
MRLTWLGEKVLRLETGLEHFLIAKNTENFKQVDIGKADTAKCLALELDVQAPFERFTGQLPAPKPKRKLDQDEFATDTFVQGENFLLIDRAGAERIIVVIDGFEVGVLPAEWVVDAIIIIAADTRDEIIKSFKEVKSKKSLTVQPRHYLLAIPTPDEELFERFVCAVGESPAQILEPGYAVEI